MEPNRLIGTACFSLLALVALTGCVDRAAQQQARETAEILSDPTTPVTLQEVKTENVQQTFIVTGQVASGQTSSVGAKVAGRVTAVFVKDGDRVRAGQVIGAQETTQLQNQVGIALQQVAAAQAQLEQARSNAMINPTRSAANVETARAQLRSAEAQLRQARAQLAKARAGARPEEVAQAESRVNQSRTAMELAKRDLERKQKLFAEGAIAGVQVEAAQNTYAAAVSNYETAVEQLRIARNATRPEDLRSAEAQVDAAEQAVAQAQEGVRSAQASQQLDVTLKQQVSAAEANLRAAQLQVQQAQTQVADATITAPFAGQVSGTPVQVGTVLSPGQEFCRIVAGEGLFFEANVPERNLSLVTVGTPVVVTIDALPGRTFQGRVAGINPVGDAVGRQFTARVQLIGADSGIKAGMFARGVIESRSFVNATVVPVSAVVVRRGRDVVYTVEDGKAKELAVVREGQSGDLAVISGVPAGTPVVIAGQTLLQSGTPVSVQPEGGSGSGGPGEG
jgi:RND family efflux transporter MFP subunit